VSAVKSNYNGKNIAAAGEKLQQEMLSPFLYLPHLDTGGVK